MRVNAIASTDPDADVPKVGGGDGGTAAVVARVSEETRATVLLQPTGKEQDRDNSEGKRGTKGEDGKEGEMDARGGAERGGGSSQTPAGRSLRSTAGLAQVGGLPTVVAEVRQMMRYALLEPELFLRYGLRPPRGLLLHGPPGTGKTMIARAAAEELGVALLPIDCAQVVSRFVGESEARLRQLFERASDIASAGEGGVVIFLDEIDALCPKRSGGGGGAVGGGALEARLVATLLTLMDGLGGGTEGGGTEGGGTTGGGGSTAVPRIVVLGATNRPHALDPAVRRPGRFDRELRVGVPDEKGRAHILSLMLLKRKSAVDPMLLPTTIVVPSDAAPGASSSGEQEIMLKQETMLVPSAAVLDIARAAHGCVGADLESMVREAALFALRRYLQDGKTKEAARLRMPHPQALLATVDPPAAPHADTGGVLVRITEAELRLAAATTRPSALRELEVAVPHIKWNQIGGQHEVKQQLKECVEWPLKHGAAFDRMGIRPPTGVLLYGPPGCSKTLLAKAMATESEMNFLAVKGPELLSMWVGESEQQLAELFRKARSAAPTILFFDEIDALASAAARCGGGGGASATGRVLSQLLVELDGISPMKSVVVVGATNRPDLLDNALMRPGRIDRALYVGLPDEAARMEIVSLQLKRVPVAADPGVVSFNFIDVAHTDATDVHNAGGGGDRATKLAKAAIAAELVARTEGYSGAELVALCREGAIAAMEELLDEQGGEGGEVAVHWRHYERALSRLRPQTSAESLDFYRRFQARN
jgi:AAA family ATPase